MASNKLNVSDLDFDDIKSNLKTFFQNQAEFSDYNFEGSGFNILLDLLAYNTHYLGFNANMLANEMYLDSADIRKNIVSIAKMLGYTPTSPKSPVADISIKLNNASGASVTMDKGTIFSTTVDGVSYQFLTNEDITISPTNGVYNFSNVSIFEGTLITFKYTVDTSDPDQKFIIPSELADTTSLKVSVQNSSSDSTTAIYTKTSGLTSIDSTSKVYYLQENEDARYEVYFGDGVLGKAVEDGNIVILEYIVSNKDASNGASSFALSGTIGGFSDVTITTNSSAQGGSDRQSKESIRFNAPLQYSAQDRAVTTSDYESLVRSLYPNTQAVSAWGGEDDETPQYGKVIIALKAKSGSTLTTQTKTNLIAQLKKYNVAAVTPEIVDPETTSLLLTSTIKYDERATIKTSDTIKSNVITTLSNYNSTTLQKFDSVFRYSKVIREIDNTDPSILSNITTIKMRKEFTPTLSTSTKYDIYFRNALFNPHSEHNKSGGGILISTGFKIDGDTTNEMFLDDDGNGNVRRYYLVGSVRTYSNNTQGTIDYTTGQITLNSLNIASISNIRGSSSTVIELTVTPSSNDVAPVRAQILEIDTSNSTITVEADTLIGGSSDAGVGYTTTTSY